jgi:Glycoside-hydrolase family GH114
MALRRSRSRVARCRALLGTIGVLLTGAVAGQAAITPPPSGAPFDYQIGGDYPLPAGVRVVTRDWFSGRPARGVYSVCYVNAFQTQADEPDAERPDERGNWPAQLVLTDLGDDPNWGGEYLVDIRSPESRRTAARWVAQMTDTCATKGFRAVEFDNLDSWTRFDGTPLAGQVPFGKAEAIAYARILTRYAHRKGLAVGQKNTAELGRRASRRVIGFDFAVSEACGTYNECAAYRRVFGSRVFDIEYTDPGLVRACATIGTHGSVVRRDRNVSTPGSPGYIFRTC